MTDDQHSHETSGGPDAAGVDPAQPASAAPAIRPRTAGRYMGRFALVYGGLALVLVGAVAGLVVLLIGSGIGGGSGTSWSDWKPTKGTTASETSQVAAHVSAQYKLNTKGSPLVAAVSSPPQVANGTVKIEVSNVVVHTKPTDDSPISVFPTGSTWTYDFCGLGEECSIASGKATTTRAQLVRREALEVALYTFKFVPGINSVVAYMPPPPGEAPSTLLYLQKDNLEQQLSEPLNKTLPLTKPPLPTQADTREETTIDHLTLPAMYSYTVTGLQDNSAVLILKPLLAP